MNLPRIRLNRRELKRDPARVAWHPVGTAWTLVILYFGLPSDETLSTISLNEEDESGREPMTCRVALFLPPDPRWIGPVTCADCGAGSLTVFYTSHDKRTHLCQSCFEARATSGLAKESQDG